MPCSRTTWGSQLTDNNGAVTYTKTGGSAKLTVSTSGAIATTGTAAAGLYTALDERPQRRQRDLHLHAHRHQHDHPDRTHLGLVDRDSVLCLWTPADRHRQQRIGELFQD
jgi:hypothetical protein